MRWIIVPAAAGRHGAAASVTIDEVLRHMRARAPVATREEVQDRLRGLTQRECQVLMHMLNGESAKTIARQLQLSHRTVEHRWADVLRKMKVHSAEALRALMHQLR